MNMVVRSSVSAAILLSLVGCSGGDDEVELGTVSGVVTLNGKPLKGVFVTFQPQGFPPSTGVTDKQGRYELSFQEELGAVIGKHEVFLGELLADEVEEYRSEIGGRPSKVPAKFQEPFQTQEVTAGHNEVNLTLSTGG